MLKHPRKYLERLVEEILHASAQVSDQSEWIADDVKTEHEHVELLDELGGVVALHFTLELLAVVETGLALKVGQP